MSTAAHAASTEYWTVQHVLARKATGSHAFVVPVRFRTTRVAGPNGVAALCGRILAEGCAPHGPHPPPGGDEAHHTVEAVS
jgi:hypothetical protein